MGFFFFPPLISCFQFHGFLLSSVLFFFFFFGVYLLFFFYFFVVETSVSDFRSVFFSNICIQCYKFPIKHCSHRIPYIWVCCILNFPLIKNIFEFWRFLLWPMWYLEMCFLIVNGFFLPTVQKQLNREMVIFLTNGVGKMDIHMKKIQINLDLNFVFYRKIQNVRSKCKT